MDDCTLACIYLVISWTQFIFSITNFKLETMTSHHLS